VEISAIIVPMPPRFSSLDGTLRIFAQPESGNTPNAEDWARSISVEALLGLYLRAWLSVDNQLVFAPQRRVGSWLRSRDIARHTRADLPEGALGADQLVSVLAGGSSATPVAVYVDTQSVATALAQQIAPLTDVTPLISVMAPETELLHAFDPAATERILTTSTKGFTKTPEQEMNRLREEDIDGLGLAHNEWNGGLVALCHRFERRAVAHDLVHEREMARVIDLGIDLAVSAHPQRLQATASLYYEFPETTEP